MSGTPVVLHQFRHSHFNEKARWGLDWKGIPHRRVSYLPGPHLPRIRRLSGQTATPVLDLDGECIAGSARILEALEARFPERPLHPRDPELRQESLQIQSEFDAEVGPAVRTALFSVLIDEPTHLCRIFAGDASAPARLLYRASFPIARGMIARANGTTDPKGIERAFERTRRALDFVEKQVGPSGYLVGDAFSIADLCCASLLAPLVNPEHPDMRSPEPVPASVQALHAGFREHRATRWVLEQYARHRPASCAVPDLLIRSALSIGLALVVACGGEPPPGGAPGADAQGFTAPTRQTVEAQAAVVRALPLADAQDFEDAQKGLVASDPNVVVEGARGEKIWDTTAYAFVQGDAPASVNPSLWRQAKLNGLHGLFEVAEGIYQVRGYDVSNLTLIRGQTGWILVDPLTSRETAQAALALARRHLGALPIVAVIFTHSHLDHFGGIDAVLAEQNAARGSVRIVAPRGFIEEAVSENVLAGVAMGRRASFMYGLRLPRDVRGHVDTGLGKTVARGTIGMREPTDLVDHTPQEMTLDGVRFVFQYAPDSEAPAELTFYLPEAKAWCGAEIVSHTLHNLYTLRGAKVRDALRWSGYIDEALERFGDAEVVFASHQWPVWGRARVVDYLKKQRDVYRFIHDQSLRLASLGRTPQEIAEEIELPESLRAVFADRGYYGTLRHNAKAVYQWYFGWYDANPANLDPLPPAEAGARYVDAMGGPAEVRRKAQAAFERGEYRWVATLLNHLVFAEPDDAGARELLARAYDQLGYQAESGPWRDVYLSGALELRHGTQATPLDLGAAMGLLRFVPIDRFFTSMATRLNGPRAAGKELTLNFVFTDLGESYVLELENAVLHHARRDPDPDAAATVRLTRDFLLRLATQQAGLRDLLFSDELAVEGSRLELLSFFSLLDQPDGSFPIVTP